MEAYLNFLIALLQDSASDLSRTSDMSVGSNDSTHNRVSPKRKKPLRTTNAYFYWVTREQGSFDWFKGVMNEIAELDQRVKKICFLITYRFLFNADLKLVDFKLVVVDFRVSLRCTTT